MTKKLKVKTTIACLTLFAWIGVGTVVFKKLESWSWIDSLYFSVATITTVGYGDLFPTTDISKLFTSFYSLIGVAVGLACLGLIGSEWIESREHIYMKKHRKKK